MERILALLTSEEVPIDCRLVTLNSFPIGGRHFCYLIGVAYRFQKMKVTQVDITFISFDGHSDLAGWDKGLLAGFLIPNRHRKRSSILQCHPIPTHLICLSFYLWSSWSKLCWFLWCLPFFCSVYIWYCYVYCCCFPHYYEIMLYLLYYAIFI